LNFNTGVAINATSVVVATSAGFIRIFSLSGVQKHIFSLSNVVSMTASADLLVIVFASSPSFTSNHFLTLPNTYKDIHIFLFIFEMYRSTKPRLYVGQYRLKRCITKR
jgi:choline-glycine betaine transporter